MKKHSLSFNTINIKRKNKMKLQTIKKQIILSNLIALSSIVTLGGAVSTVTASPLGNLADQWYVGGSVGYSDMDPDGEKTWSTTDGKDVSKKVYVGTDISQQIGLEAFWADFGDAKLKSKTGETGKIHYKAVGANVVYNAPVKFAGFRPIGKLGVAKFTNKDKGSVKSKQNNKLAVFGGVGVEYDLTRNLKVRSEYEYFDKDIKNLSVGLNWSPSLRDHSFIANQNVIQKKPVVVERAPAKVYVAPPRPVVRKQPKPRIVYRQAKPRIVYRPAPVAAPQYKIVNKTLSGGSHFDSGSAQLTLNGRNILNKLAQDLRGHTVKSIRVVGHTDSVGSDQSNLSLSYARANSVADYLALQGVNRQLINTQGMGERRPVADNNTEHGRALNRRVEITVKSASRIRIR